MLIKYSEHIKTRLTLRKIDHDLPKLIYENADERFLDTETDNLIALMKTTLYGEKRDIIVAYKQEGKNITLLTIHP